MTDSPYAIPLEELVDTARVPLAEQVVEQPERRYFGGDGGGGADLGGDCGADGD